jgi:phosphomannomutase
MDGVKLFLNALTMAMEPGWVLFAGSGTSSLRVYSEAATPELVAEILEQAKSFVNSSS